MFVLYRLFASVMMVGGDENPEGDKNSLLVDTNLPGKPVEVSQTPQINLTPATPPLPPTDASVPAAADVRTGWIYLLKKGDLVMQLQMFKLDATGTVEELRRRLVKFIKEGKATPQPTTQPFIFPSVSNSPIINPVPTISLTTCTTTTVTVTGSTPITGGLSQGTVGYQTTPYIPTIVTPATTIPTTANPLIANYSSPLGSQIGANTRGIPGSTHVSLFQGSPPIMSRSSQLPSYQQPTSSASNNIYLNTAIPNIYKWNLHFSGTGDPATFLERLDELCTSENITRDSILPYLPELLQGEASLWFRNNKHNWRYWNDFQKAFRNFYFPVNYEVDLEAEISRRLQKPNEPSSSYITELQTLIRRHGNISHENELQWLYRNLLPEYRQYIRRTDFHDITSFCKMVREFEILRQEVLRSQNTSSNRQSYYSQNLASHRAGPVSVSHPPSSNYKSQNPNSPCPPPTPAQQVQPSTSNTNLTSTGIRTSLENAICWRCGNKGHLRNQCRGTKKLFCSRCGKENILSRDCPCPKKQGN